MFHFKMCPILSHIPILDHYMFRNVKILKHHLSENVACLEGNSLHREVPVGLIGTFVRKFINLAF